MQNFRNIAAVIKPSKQKKNPETDNTLQDLESINWTIS